MGTENPFKNEPETLKSQRIHEGELLKGGATYDNEGHLIPTEDQINQARLEMHGESFDSAVEFVKFNKKIVFPEMDSKELCRIFGIKDLKEYTKKGWFIVGGNHEDFIMKDNDEDFTFRFVDKDGNICDVDSSKQEIAQKISSISTKNGFSEAFSEFHKQLIDSGVDFSWNVPNDSNRRTINHHIEKYKKDKIESIKNKKAEELGL